MRGSATSWVLAFSALAVGACATPPGGAPAQNRSGTAHFTAAEEIQTQVIVGDLDTARRLARSLEREAGEWRSDRGTPLLRQAFVGRARRVAESTDLVTISRAAAELARGCGECHSGIGRSVRLSGGLAPPEGTTIRDHMVRHIWAVDRMWEGLIAPSVESWRAGAAVLADDPLDSTTGVSPAITGPLSETVHAAGLEAQTATAPNEWVELYGALLTTCSACHEALGVQVLR